MVSPWTLFNVAKRVANVIQKDIKDGRMKCDKCGHVWDNVMQSTFPKCFTFGKCRRIQ